MPHNPTGSAHFGSRLVQTTGPPRLSQLGLRHALAAVCQSGTCEKLNLLETPFTACMQDAECQLRIGSGCCAGCSVRSRRINGSIYYNGGLVALSDLDGFLDAYCPEAIACDPCAGSIPPEVIAQCIQGRCLVQYSGEPLSVGE